MDSNDTPTHLMGQCCLIFLRNASIFYNFQRPIVKIQQSLFLCSTVGIILGPNSSSLTQLTPISSGMSGDMKPVLPQSGALIDPSTTEAYPGKSHGKKKVDFTDPVSFFKFTPISQSYGDRVTKFQLFCNFLQTRWSCSIWVGKGPFLVPTKFVVRSWCNFLCTNKILELPGFFLGNGNYVVFGGRAPSAHFAAEVATLVLH